MTDLGVLVVLRERIGGDVTILGVVGAYDLLGAVVGKVCVGIVCVETTIIADIVKRIR